jgi:hypothetical protein
MSATCSVKLKLRLEVVMCRNSSVASCVCHRPAAQPSELQYRPGVLCLSCTAGNSQQRQPPDARSRLYGVNEHILDLGCRCRWEGNAVAYHVVGGVQGLTDEYSRDINI